MIIIKNTILILLFNIFIMNEEQFYFTYLFFKYFPSENTAGTEIYYDLWLDEVLEIANKYFTIFNEIGNNENFSLYDAICRFFKKYKIEIETDIAIRNNAE